MNTPVPPIVATLITTVVIGARWIQTVKGELGDTVQLGPLPRPAAPAASAVASASPPLHVFARGLVPCFFCASLTLSVAAFDVLR